MALTQKFKRNEIDEDFKNLNEIINTQISLIQSKYGDAVILIQAENNFNVGYLIDQDSLDSGNT